jgi:hypothetical protein
LVYNRKLSKSQQYVNLFIRYKRDFECDPAWIDIKPYIHHETLPFEIFKTHEVIPNLPKIPILLRATEEAIETEMDGRKRKTLQRELSRLEALKPWHDEVLQNIKLSSSPYASLIGINRMIEWGKAQRVEQNLLINNHSHVSIKGINVDAQELNEFIYDFDETSSVFSIKNKFDNVILIFELMKGHWSYGYNQEEGYAVENQLMEWRVFCKTIDVILEDLKRSSYYKQGKTILFEALEKKQLQDNKEYMLLKMIIHYERRSGKQVQLTSKSVQEVHLMTSLSKYYPEKTIKKLFKYLRK